MTGATCPRRKRGFAFRFLGLAGLADPLRPGVAEAIGQCVSAGIRVAVISGDFPETARAIAAEAGIAAEGVVTGDVLAGLSDEALRERVKSANVFARIMPEQKLRIVNALKANGEIVAMTGDGVNDAPSLKSAHIGVAMGGRGTDVAREASSIVLLKDDFGSIVAAVRLGRRIYDNLRKAMSFIFAVHLPIAGHGAFAAFNRHAGHLRADPHRFSRNGHRSGLLAGFRGRDRGRRHHAPAAARSGRTAFYRQYWCYAP